MAMLIEFQGKLPQVAEGVFLAPTAVLIGDVQVGEGANIWFGAVLRGDLGRIVIGARTSVQDNVVLHVNPRHDTLIGADIILGHGAILEGCTIGHGCMVGMNATVLSGAQVGENSLIAAGTLVREGQIIPSGVLAAGVPAQIKRELDEESRQRLARGASNYTTLMARYEGRFLHSEKD